MAKKKSNEGGLLGGAQDALKGRQAQLQAQLQKALGESAKAKHVKANEKKK